MDEAGRTTLKRASLLFSLLPYASNSPSMLIGTPLLALLAVASSAVAVPTSSSSTGTSSSSSSSSSAPVVDLGKYGKYKGVVQNNGTVHSWKGRAVSLPRRDLSTSMLTFCTLSFSPLPVLLDVADSSHPLRRSSRRRPALQGYFHLFPSRCHSRRSLTSTSTAPRALAKQNSTVQDVSADFPGHPTACVQFGTTSFVGVNAGPGQEDCLKVSRSSQPFFDDS